VEAVFENADIKSKFMVLNTDGSLETTLANLRNTFSAKVIIVNHESRLDVDTACSNLAIKYNMLYLSVHQSIKHNILSKSPIGKELLASMKPKSIAKAVNDEASSENDYCAVHFDLRVVIKML
jgi:hypothetical protein